MAILNNMAGTGAYRQPWNVNEREGLPAANYSSPIGPQPYPATYSEPAGPQQTVGNFIQNTLAPPANPYGPQSKKPLPGPQSREELEHEADWEERQNAAFLEHVRQNELRRAAEEESRYVPYVAPGRTPPPPNQYPFPKDPGMIPPPTNRTPGYTEAEDIVNSWRPQQMPMALPMRMKQPQTLRRGFYGAGY
jgi:hypothetical protein